MVTGVTVLVNLMSNVGGMDLFAKLIAKMSTAGTVTLVAGFWAGLVSAYASTTGVILPAFLPMAAPLLKEVGGTNLLALVSSIVVCGFVVDLSPLSTTGAVFISNAVPYIRRLDAGSSDQAPAGFVRYAVSKAILEAGNGRIVA